MNKVEFRRDLTVPPPPLRTDEGSPPAAAAAAAASSTCESTPSGASIGSGGYFSHRRPGLGHRAAGPNALLAKAMAGRVADWDRIRFMAEQIVNPKYSLRAFFNDCIVSFPELSLFFEGAGSRRSKDGKKRGPTNGMQASSGIAAEAEYQRTIGALFAVYWLLRLGIDGESGFCYGVTEEWKPVGQPSKEVDASGKSFFKMTPDEKRAGFLRTTDWSPFAELTKRAGCVPASDSPEDIAAATKRIMALLCLTSFHDIMKLPILQPVVHPDHAPYHGHEAGVWIHDHDLALSYVLEHYPNLLPSYAGLEPAERRAILFTQGKMQFNHGWFVQAEAPPGGMLSTFKAVLQEGASQADIDLYFLHWVTDLAGAEPTPLGGAEKLVLKFPHAVFASFLWSMPFLSQLAETSETELVEKYLEARWMALLPNEPVPNDFTSITIMRLVVMAQGEDPMTVVEAFRALPAADQSCLTTEFSRTGCRGQTYQRNTVCGGPAFLVYYSPALLQRNNKSKDGLEKALRTLCQVLRGARGIWPMSLRQQHQTVIIQIGELKAQDIDVVIRDPGGEYRSVWIVLRNNDKEGVVTLCRASDLNALYMAGAKFRVLDFAVPPPPPPVETSLQLPILTAAGLTSLTEAEPMDNRDRDFAKMAFRNSKRILVFTDLSTECDDECALLWLVAALNRRGVPTTVELVHTDSYVRLQWMAHILADKFATGGEWELQDGNASFVAGCVLVNMYLLHSPMTEERVIKDLETRAPNLQLSVTTIQGKRVGIRQRDGLAADDYTNILSGPLDSVVVAAPIGAINPAFFKRFEDCKCCYVVGTPGGVNCPMPSWVDILAALHQLTPVMYLTPQLTRTIRFPRSYVAENVIWNETIRRTVWDSTVTFMARRPEIPAPFGNWGLVLRLNVANATFCKDWYRDVEGADIEKVEKPDRTVDIVKAYVDRNSGDDRDPGAIVLELRNIGIEHGLEKGDLDERQMPTNAKAKERLKELYREALFENVFMCVHTTYQLLFNKKENVKVGVDDAGFENLVPRCGYTDPAVSLKDTFGADDAIQLVQQLPLRRLTPAYDVVAMICADSALEEGTELDGDIGLLLDTADDSMGMGLLSKEQRGYSEHPILMTLPQAGEGVYALGPFG
eukprot:TRINITY_DN42019_c0_g1_i1.p1 TRINITY_DN42019_c0_g1~~TRINITY_DN42019_c0_g1_i1.p1  ORF type:complete len:1132 (-),score=273.91 TRINITY_DN42019_c0_g1_i1:347-3742(-)